MKFVIPFVAVSLSGAVAATAVFNYLALREFESIMWSTHISVKTTDELVRPLFINVNIINIIFVTALLIIAGIWMMRKTSGPLYRMLGDIRRVADGDLSTDITLRQNDELKDTAHELDAMVKSIKDRFSSINEKYADVSKSVEGLKREPVDKETSKKAHTSILEKVRELETEINGFKLSQKERR